MEFILNWNFTWNFKRPQEKRQTQKAKCESKEELKQNEQSTSFNKIIDIECLKVNHQTVWIINGKKVVGLFLSHW